MQFGDKSGHIIIIFIGRTDVIGTSQMCEEASLFMLSIISRSKIVIGTTQNLNNHY